MNLADELATMFFHRSKKRVLLVEDCPDDSLLSRIELEENGLTVVCAEYGSDAIRLAGDAEIAQEQFDIAIVDIKLPDMSGLEVAKQLKTAYPFMAILICSGALDGSIVVAALMEQFFVVPKPLRLQNIKGLLESLCVHN